MPPADLCDTVRSTCAELAAAARWVTIDAHAYVPAAGRAGLDAKLHFLEGDAEDVARYVLILDAVNFGSGWFPTLRSEGDESLTDAMTRRLTEHARRRGPWTAAELRRMNASEIARVLGQGPEHELMRLYAAALVQLGVWLGDRPAMAAVDAAGGSAERFATALAAGMPFFDDAGFWKRAQIAANDLALAGVAAWADVDRLTVFADNLVPHVLRMDGVLTYAPELAAVIDGGRLLTAGGAMEREVRACAVHACEKIAARCDVAPRTLDNWLWNKGQAPPYSDRPAHLTRTVFY